MPPSGCGFTSSAALQQCAAASLRRGAGLRVPGSGAPAVGLGVPGSARPWQRPAAGHGPLWLRPAGNMPGVRNGRRAQRSARDRIPGDEPGEPAEPAPAGARRWGHPRWGHPRWGHPPPGPTPGVFSITLVRAPSLLLSGFSHVEAAPRDPAGHRSTHRSGSEGARLPQEFFAPLMDDPPC